ncbi:MAG TPA: chorismate-binding protein [Micromonosporaceae bacterium]|nr:chorismate-binding protein [Micromonosporaceae bacterium]
MNPPVDSSLPPPGLWERSRMEWRIGDGGDPAQRLEDFLSDAGLPVRDLASSHGAVGSSSRSVTPAGAAVLLSAAAAAGMVGAPALRSPSSAVPDAVAIVYDRHPESPSIASGDPDSGGAGWAVQGWRSSWTRDEHAAAVRAARAAIARGDVYQVNLVGHASAAYRGDPRPALRRVAGLAGARYGRVLTGTGWGVASASPETLVEVRGGRVVTRPIKGTRPATAVGATQLMSSAKERAEHIMIVDLARNDLARVAQIGTVSVDELYSIRRWCGLWQAESTVAARLVGGTGLAALLRALCPGGSVTGAPKHAALDLIAQLEPVGRGPSMGAIGWIGPDGLDLGLTIRTVAVDAQRLHVWAGGGITWGSDPWAEVAEAAAKAAPLLAALAGPVRPQR